jgi:hypothetical protein
LPELDLPPGDYRERKPKGWRWRLPWSHPEDTKLPMVGFFVCVGFIAMFYIRRSEASVDMAMLGTGLFAFFAGGCMVLWLRD